MPAREVTVVARIKGKHGMEEVLRNELLALIPPTRQEKGYITYRLHQAADDKTLFMFYETWSSKEDLDVHLNRPHIRAFLDKGDELLAEPPHISLWQMIG